MDLNKHLDGLKEDPEAYALAAVGAVEGLWNYYIKTEITAKRAWIGLIGAISLYELAAPKGELLSQGVDRAIEKHPILTRAAIGYVALHLCNMLPEKLDLFHQLTKAR